MEIINLPAAYILLALTSLAIGSLLNVFIYRIPLMLRAEWAQNCHILFNMPYQAEQPLNLFLPRSFCPHCKATVPAKHNIPILSYLILRGRCFECGRKISARYPLIEALCTLLSVFAAWHFGFNLSLLFALPFIWILIVLFFIDLEQQLLPDCLTLSLLWLGLIANTQALFTNLSDAVLTAVAAYLFLWLLIRCYYLLTKKIGMGNGDFKLFAAFAAWFGWTLMPFILLFASLSGALIGIFYLKKQGKSNATPIPFGPFLCLAGLVALFWGKAIMNWYLLSVSVLH